MLRLIILMLWPDEENIGNYHLSKLVRALLLVNLAGRTLLYGRLKFKVDSVQNCFVIYRQLFLTFIASKNLKHFLYSKLCIKEC